MVVKTFKLSKRKFTVQKKTSEFQHKDYMRIFAFRLQYQAGNMKDK